MQAEEAGSAAGPEPGWGWQKIHLSQAFANRVFARIRKCEMHVFSQAFANMLSQKYLGFANFRKYDFARFRELSRKFANALSQCFAIFRKLSHGFAGIRKWTFAGVRHWRIRKCENHGFSQGFAMPVGTLLMRPQPK